MSKNKIEIDNPLPGTSPYASVKRAAYYVGIGVAEMVNGRLRFNHLNPLDYIPTTERKSSDVYDREFAAYVVVGSKKFPHTQCIPFDEDKQEQVNA